MQNRQSPLYELVPKGFYENLEYRKRILLTCATDEKAQEDYWVASKRDILFYVNTFCWTHDPKNHPECPIIPFITYEYQDEALLALVYAIQNGEDRLIEKSREMGATWLSAAVFEWFWHFYDDLNFLIGSRKQEYVDGDARSVFWKIDFLLKRQPGWLKPPVVRGKNRIQNHLTNVENGSCIDGEATVEDFGRGDRRTAIFLDEFASVADGHAILSATRDTTNSRIFNSTPKGTANAFYEMRQSLINNGLEDWILRFHWTAHPVKAIGLYYVDGKARSPWYDKECKRCVHPAEIAQELDINYHGADFQFFDEDTLTKIISNDCRPPYYEGEISYDQDELTFLDFTERAQGLCKIWTHMDANKEPRRDHQYVAGADVAVGTGGAHSSNSTLVLYDATTCEKVFEYANNRISPYEFARFAIVVCRWFGGARLIWEANGAGRDFGNNVIKFGYTNYYFRRNEDSISKKSSDIPGWWSSVESKKLLLGQYKNALGTGEILNRSEEAIKECRHYVFLLSRDGAVEHSKAAAKGMDPTAHGANHGDRVIADALAWHIMQKPVEKKPEPVAMPGSFMYRRKERVAAKRKESGWLR